MKAKLVGAAVAAFLFTTPVSATEIIDVPTGGGPANDNCLIRPGECAQSPREVDYELQIADPMASMAEQIRSIIEFLAKLQDEFDDPDSRFEVVQDPIRPGAFTYNLLDANNVVRRAGTVTIAATGAVPEPASWAMMTIGFGTAGLARRRRRGATGRIQAA